MHGLILSLALPLCPQAAELVIDPAADGPTFQAGVRGQNPYRNGKNTPDNFAICRGALARGPAGGLDADTYDWRDVDSGVWNKGPRYTTLEWLELVRDHDCEPLVTVNCIGGGRLDESGTFECALGDLERTAGLAADWVRYCNFILQARRARSPEERRVLADISGFGDKPKLPERSSKRLPKVLYWEIGNEPELDAIPGFISGHRLEPAVYAEHYRAIAQAMRAVDPEIKVGPCIIYPAATGGRYLESILELADAPLDFVCFHPYYHELQAAWGDTGKLTEALLGLEAHLVAQIDAARALLGDREAELIASEWNPMMWNAQAIHYGSMAMALGTLEGIFTFAESGLLGANFWEDAAGKKAVRLVYEKLQELPGDRLVVASTVASCRIYAYAVDKRKRLLLWALNFDEASAQTLDVQLTGVTRIRKLTEHRLSGPEEKTGLMTHEGLSWKVELEGARRRGGLPPLRCPAAAAVVWEIEW